MTAPTVVLGQPQRHSWRLLACVLALAALVVATASLTMPSSASALSRYVQCFTVSQEFCETNDFHSYKYLDVFTQYHRDHVCAGAKSGAGTVKAGSSCSTGSVSEWHVTLSSSTPISEAYGVWVGNGSRIWTDVYADTP